MRAEDAQGTPTQSHISTSVPAYEAKKRNRQTDHDVELRVGKLALRAKSVGFQARWFGRFSRSETRV